MSLEWCRKKFGETAPFLYLGEEIAIPIERLICLPPRAILTPVYEWCDVMEIDANLIWAGRDEGIGSVWPIDDEQHRTAFAIRWL